MKKVSPFFMLIAVLLLSSIQNQSLHAQTKDELTPKGVSAALDQDQDGILNHEDLCPEAPGLPERKGCPIEDADEDGVEDDKDACPLEYGVVAFRGCPDSDGDGVMDRNDGCPNVPGSLDFNGCPDSDQDEVSDQYDQCPNTKGDFTAKGCPVIDQADKDILEMATASIDFETGSSRLTGKSLEILDQVTELLDRNEGFLLKISGHTDNIGSASSNLRLSEKRAEACYAYLLEKGAAAARLEYIGFGESRPIANNKYRDGREKNRRVEFEMLWDNSLASK